MCLFPFHSSSFAVGVGPGRVPLDPPNHAIESWFHLRVLAGGGQFFSQRGVCGVVVLTGVSVRLWSPRSFHFQKRIMTGSYVFSTNYCSFFKKIFFCDRTVSVSNQSLWIADQFQTRNDFRDFKTVSGLLSYSNLHCHKGMRCCR